MTGVLIKRGNLDRDTARENIDWRGRQRLNNACSQGITRLCVNNVKAGEGQGRFSLTALSRNPPCWHLDLGLPELRDNKPLLYESAGLWYFVTAAPEKNRAQVITQLAQSLEEPRSPFFQPISSLLCHGLVPLRPARCPLKLDQNSPKLVHFSLDLWWEKDYGVFRRLITHWVMSCLSQPKWPVFDCKLLTVRLPTLWLCR